MARASVVATTALHGWLQPSISASQALAIQGELDDLVAYFEQPWFVGPDPISVTYQYQSPQNKEIMGLFAALFAWGRRDITLAKCAELASILGDDPYRFIQNHDTRDFEHLPRFAHRTFNNQDLTCFLTFFKAFYKHNDSLEAAFVTAEMSGLQHVGPMIAQFHHLFINADGFTQRTRKHVSTPLANSACKRLCMFLRWMVRPQAGGVDLGLWQKIQPAQLVCPIDIHVSRQALKLGLLATDKTNWSAAVQLTSNLRLLDPLDPVKYDFALFGLGVNPDVNLDKRPYFMP